MRAALALTAAALVACPSSIQVGELAYPCDVTSSDTSQCPAGWKCGVGGVCRAAGQPGRFACTSSDDCEGWLCGSDGLCRDLDAALPYACVRSDECGGGWRCSAAGVCFDPAAVVIGQPCSSDGQCPDAARCGHAGTCQLRGAPGAYTCAADTDCEADWRCSLEGRCLDAGADGLQPQRFGTAVRARRLNPELPISAPAHFAAYGDPGSRQVTHVFAEQDNVSIVRPRAQVVSTLDGGLGQRTTVHNAAAPPGLVGLLARADDAWLLSAQGLSSLSYADGGAGRSFPNVTGQWLRAVDTRRSLLAVADPTTLWLVDLDAGTATSRPFRLPDAGTFVATGLTSAIAAQFEPGCLIASSAHDLYWASVVELDAGPAFVDAVGAPSAEPTWVRQGPDNFNQDPLIAVRDAGVIEEIRAFSGYDTGGQLNYRLTMLLPPASAGRSRRFVIMSNFFSTGAPAACAKLLPAQVGRVYGPCDACEPGEELVSYDDVYATFAVCRRPLADGGTTSVVRAWSACQAIDPGPQAYVHYGDDDPGPTQGATLLAGQRLALVPWVDGLNSRAAYLTLPTAPTSVLSSMPTLVASQGIWGYEPGLGLTSLSSETAVAVRGVDGLGVWQSGSAVTLRGVWASTEAVPAPSLGISTLSANAASARAADGRVAVAAFVSGVLSTGVTAFDRPLELVTRLRPLPLIDPRSISVVPAAAGRTFAALLVYSSGALAYTERGDDDWGLDAVSLPVADLVSTWSDGSAGRIAARDGRIFSWPSRVELSRRLPAGVTALDIAPLCSQAVALTAGGLFTLTAGNGVVGDWQPLDVSAALDGAPVSFSSAKLLYSSSRRLELVFPEGLVIELSATGSPCP